MKKLLKLTKLAIVFLIAIPQISCNNDDDSNSDCGNTDCTEIFVTIVVSVEDQDQNPIALDSFEVINIEDGSEMTIPLSASGLELSQQLGQYPLIADGSIEVNQEVQLQFKGFIDNQEVINTNYTVSSDCCHINLVSGNIHLVL